MHTYIQIHIYTYIPYTHVHICYIHTIRTFNTAFSISKNEFFEAS